MTDTAVVVLADPESGSDEALGRLFNALFVTYELKQKGESVALIFQGAGARWGREVTRTDHPAHALYKHVEENLVVCGGCADVFGAAEDIKARGLAMVRQREIPGTSGVVDLSAYLGGDRRLLIF